MIGKGLMDKYNELIAKLDQILKTNSSNKDNTVLSSADEIRKFKALLDDGIITKQEFEIKNVNCYNKNNAPSPAKKLVR